MTDDNLVPGETQVKAAFDLICDRLLADFDGQVTECSLTWVVGHGRYEIRRIKMGGEVEELALYYPGAGPMPPPEEMVADG